MRVVFKGPLKRSLGFDEMEVEPGEVSEVLERISEKLGVRMFIEGRRVYMKIKSGGKSVKFTMSLFHNGKNVMTSGIQKLEDGTLEIITPMGGG